MYTHFIFDIDGTLVDTEQTGLRSLGKTVKEMSGREMSLDELYYFFGIPSYEASKMLGIGNPDLFAERWEENFQELFHLSCVFEGIPEVMAAVKAAERTMGIVTSRSKFEYDKDPLMAPWKPDFKVVICSEDSETHKPLPGPALAFLERSGARPGDCIYIGDTLHDCSCAHGAGIAFALADWKGRGAQNIPAEYHFTRPEEIVSLLEY